MNSLPMSFAGALVVLPVCAQVVVIDNFSVGDFLDSGSQNSQIVTQSGLDSADVLGGARSRRIQHAGFGYVWDVADNRMSVDLANSTTILSLAWGDLDVSGSVPNEYVGTALGIDLEANNNQAFQLVVPRLIGGSVQGEIVVQTSSLGESVTTPFTLNGPGTYTIPFSSLSGSADLGNINGIFLHFPDIVVPAGNTLNLEIGSFTMVPEPAEWAVAVGVGMLGWGVWRRRFWNR
ncbi:MAG: hypothetical protein J0M24_05505 [Verrucomicrobia bacterium]|nr:hypothetical protein [Verrucomicrobiota bacterium]